MVYQLLVYAILGVLVIVLTFRLVTTSQMLSIAKRQLGVSRQGRSAAQAKAQRAEQLCETALESLNQAIENAGQALEVREHLAVVGTQLRSLVEYIESPWQQGIVPSPRDRRGRHARALVPVPSNEKIELYGEYTA